MAILKKGLPLKKMLPCPECGAPVTREKIFYNPEAMITILDLKPEVASEAYRWLNKPMRHKQCIKRKVKL